MDFGDKKKIIAVVVILILAGIVFSLTRSADKGTGIDSIKAGEKITLMCRNCSYVFEMEKRDYYKKIEEVSKPEDLGWPKIDCPKCQKPRIDRAEKCGKCGKVFFLYSVPNDFPDKCPYCGYSKSQ